MEDSFYDTYERIITYLRVKETKTLKKLLDIIACNMRSLPISELRGRKLKCRE